MSDRAPHWVVPAMRAGYSSRAAVYLIIGGLALWAAFYGGSAEGSTGALEALRTVPFGQILLWIVGLGLWCYALWRFLCAAMDLEERGTDGTGIIARIGQTVTGLIHLGLGLTAIQLAMGGSSGSGPETIVGMVLSMPGGRWITGIVGVIVIGTGLFYVHKGYAEKFRKYLAADPTMERLVPAAKAGLMAHGGVIALLGVFVIFAALRSDASEAGGFGAAFEAIRAQAYGRVLLAFVALGMLCYAIYNLIEARYRVVRRAAGDSIKTLAQKAKAAA